MATIQELMQSLEAIAPPQYQESYDNAGLIVGDPKTEITGVITCLDSTEAVVAEAIARGCNCIVAHHPIVFKGLKTFTGKNYVERTIIKAIRHGIAIYAIHTNLDNVYQQGVNGRIAAQLGLQNTRILQAKALAQQLSTTIPSTALSKLAAGLATLGITDLQKSWMAEDEQRFLQLNFTLRPDQIGSIHQLLIQAQARNTNQWAVNTPIKDLGSGMIGYLAEPMPELDFLELLKTKMQTDCVKHTALRGQSIQKVALCGGSGGFLLSKAIREKADIFITADYKYHEFFDADGKIIIADIGHYESEQFTIDLLAEIVSNKFSTFAVYKTQVHTNPVSYFV